MKSESIPIDPSTGLTLTLVTNSIRSIAPNTTFAANPTKYVDAEIAVVKPAVLYADHVILKSYLIDVAIMAHAYEERRRLPLHSLTIPIQFAGDAHPKTLEEYGIDPSRIDKAAFKAFWQKWSQEVREGRGRTEDVADFYDQHQAVICDVENALFGAATRFIDSIDLNPFEQAVESGVLKVSGWSDQTPGMFEPEEDYVDRAAPPIYEMLLDPRRNLVFDHGAAVSLGTNQDALNELKLASSILQPLPVFSKASIDELLDIRTELRSPLTRFRAEVASMAKTLPDGADHEIEVANIWRAKIKPAVEEIDELTEENKYLRQLADKVMEAKTVLPATATFALGVAGLSGIAQVCAAAAGIASIPLEAARTKRKQTKDLKRKQFYFIWKLQQNQE